ncbi:MAG: DUF1294 domain-containing protein [Actinomycetota bacterium]|jgi:uncharacterized membrane protein YsdA (DUF1294 family)|nr:DUF1294 domain-containing protein [Actinomycetota bacterium]
MDTLTSVGPIRLVLLGVYVAMSSLAFIMYGMDKAAARQGRWRTPEVTLHLVSAFGGWPGALVAQRVFRHKTRKQPFRMMFWFTVIINCIALVWLVANLPS